MISRFPTNICDSQLSAEGEMIRIVNGGAEDDVDRDAMFHGRKRVFVDRLKWPLRVTAEGREVDQFDGPNALYLIARDGAGVVAGSMRLMPTTGPTLLTDVFADSFDEPVDIRSATIWEVTRFCVHPNAREVTPTGANRITAELGQGLAEVAIMSGLSHIIGLYDQRMIRVYAQIGWPPSPLATSLPSLPGKLFVGLWEVSTSALAAMQARSGISGSVLAGDVSAAPFQMVA